MTNFVRGTPSRYAFYAVALATIAIYWTGLNGPFLLDDTPNLAPLQRWMDGQAGMLELILGNTSGSLGRPVSMLTLWFSAATGGMHPFPFKLGNLLIHLLCGWAGWQMLRRLLDQDPRLATRASLVAAALAGLWLLHPINVSTVLYAVQRMAQLSTLFVLLAVWMYVRGRQQLIEGHARAALIRLFVLFPLLLLAGLFSKENAAVAPALCLVVELAYFSRQPRSGHALPTFYAAFLLLPALAAIAIMVAMPDTLFGLYATRDFTMLERLLSQPRALMEYLGLVFWPRGGMMGVFVDDFVVSTGLLSPASTLLAIVALLAISGIAIAMRRQAPSVFAGWFFFLVAHGVESTLLPLELYFEHRNYLPLFGLLLASAGLLAWLLDKLAKPEPVRERIGLALPAVAAVALAAITWQQVQVWKSMDSIVAQALANRPGSLRAVLEQTRFEVNAQRWDDVRVTMLETSQSNDPRHQVTAHLSLLILDCLQHGKGSTAHLSAAESAHSGTIQLIDVLTYRPLSKAVLDGRCGPELDASTVANSIVRVLDKSGGQADTSKPKWLLRALATELYMHQENYGPAMTQARLAWQPRVADTAIGGLLLQLQMRAGDKGGATLTLDQIQQRTPAYAHRTRAQIAKTRAQVELMPDPAGSTN